ncbi:hypothetical protein C5C07_02065 [Haloferax sp. Atlit-4N]|uniref:hypothetical protein n=1 Tax=Haloferax sp. Atlit-4N TaxID=2077206 RepID=UPI000E27C434|nr:hypothetical protein [Haloferax sp. Atlit-4N]RDZ54342.1 hypothetical protein C5C07_02065 [Haloferax sp. Atlit-4N]
MYTRTHDSGAVIEWTPNDTELAKQALSETDGTGVTSKSEVSANAPLELGKEVARAVTERYRQLLAEKTSGGA